MAGNGRRFTSRAMSLQLLRSAAPTGGWSGYGILRGSRRRSSCDHRCSRMCLSWRPAIRRVCSDATNWPQQRQNWPSLRPGDWNWPLKDRKVSGVRSRELPFAQVAVLRSNGPGVDASDFPEALCQVGRAAETTARAFLQHATPAHRSRRQRASWKPSSLSAGALLGRNPSRRHPRRQLGSSEGEGQHHPSGLPICRYTKKDVRWQRIIVDSGRRLPHIAFKHSGHRQHPTELWVSNHLRGWLRPILTLVRSLSGPREGTAGGTDKARPCGPDAKGFGGMLLLSLYSCWWSWP